MKITTINSLSIILFRSLRLSSNRRVSILMSSLSFNYYSQWSYFAVVIDSFQQNNQFPTFFSNYVSWSLLSFYLNQTSLK